MRSHWGLTGYSQRHSGGSVCLGTTQQTIQRPATTLDVGSLPEFHEHPLCWDFSLLSELERPCCRSKRQKQTPISQSECCPSKPQNHHKSTISQGCGHGCFSERMLNRMHRFGEAVEFLLQMTDVIPWAFKGNGTLEHQHPSKCAVISLCGAVFLPYVKNQ